MKLSGRIITWIGGFIVIAACFLHFGLNVSLWSADPRDALFITLLALTGVTLSIVSIFVDFPVLVGAQVAIGVYLFGQAFTLGGGPFSGLQIGFWLASIASLAMVIGASLLAASIWSTGGWSPTTGLVDRVRRPIVAQMSPSTAPVQVQQTNGGGHPAAGWYQDPSGQASLRYWSGATWTDQVRS